MANAARDENRVPTLIAASDVDGTPVILLADPVTGRLKVTSTGGGGGAGTEYADGAARGTATGTLAMGDDGTNIQSVKVDSSGVLAIQDNGGSITVDGTVTANTGLSQPLTDTQLRATAVPISGTITANAGTNLNTSALALDATLTTSNTRLGDITETAPASDTASSGLNGRLQRIAQRLTSIIALLPSSLGQKARASSLAVTLSSEDVTALTPPAAITGFATSTLQTTGNTSLSTIATNTTRPTLISERTSNTDGASTAFTNFGALASNFNYIFAISVFRTDAGTTPIYIDFRDGTAGSVLYSVVLPPNGGAVMANHWQAPLFRTSVNTALAYDVNAATTSVFISMSGFRSTT